MLARLHVLPFLCGVQHPTAHCSITVYCTIFLLVCQLAEDLIHSSAAVVSVLMSAEKCEARRAAAIAILTLKYQVLLDRLYSLTQPLIAAAWGRIGPHAK